MSTKSKKIIFGIFYFGFFIILGFLVIQFLFTADYNKNLIEFVVTSPLRFVGNERGRLHNMSPIIVATVFLSLSITSFITFLNSQNNRNGVILGLIFSGLLFLGFLISIFRYFSQASLFDFIF